MHRFAWDLHYALPKELGSGTRGSRGGSGPWAPPGRYTVRLTSAGKSVARPLVVAKDPRLPSSVTDADLVRQYELARDVQAERIRVAAALEQAASLRKQIDAARANTAGAAVTALNRLSEAIDRAAGPAPLTPGEESFDPPDADPTTLRRLGASLSGLQSAVESADAAPTPDAITGFAERRKLVDRSLDRWRILVETELPGASKALEAAGQKPLKTE